MYENFQANPYILKADRPHRAIIRIRPLIIDTQTKHLRFVMAPIAPFPKRFSRETGDRRTEGRYQVHYLPRFALNKYNMDKEKFNLA